MTILYHQMQVPISDDSAFFTVTCFTVWRHTLWVGTNRGTIAVMDADDGKCVHEIFFPGGRRKQVEIKHLALSSEDEVRVYVLMCIHTGQYFSTGASPQESKQGSQ